MISWFAVFFFSPVRSERSYGELHYDTSTVAFFSYLFQSHYFNYSSHCNGSYKHFKFKLMKLQYMLPSLPVHSYIHFVSLLIVIVLCILLQDNLPIMYNIVMNLRHPVHMQVSERRLKLDSRPIKIISFCKY